MAEAELSQEQIPLPGYTCILDYQSKKLSVILHGCPKEASQLVTKSIAVDNLFDDPTPLPDLVKPLIKKLSDSRTIFPTGSGTWGFNEKNWDQ